MLRRDFGSTGWQVSAIGMGTWNIGNQWDTVDETTAWATIRASFDHGVNLFDSAESYGIPNGLSEERLGKGLAGIRHQAYVVTKIGNWGMRTGQEVPKTSVDMIRLCAHACLHRLRTDWIDVLLCHKGDLQNPDVYLEGFEALKQEGRIRVYGISTDSLDVLKRFNVHDTCRVVQLNYSLLNRAAETQLLPYCEEHGIAVMVRGPLAQGLLSGRYTRDTVFTDTVRASWHTDEAKRRKFEHQIAEVEKLKQGLKPGSEMVTAALRYVISHQAGPTAIPGPKSPDQAAMNAGAGSETLTDEAYNGILRLLN